MLRKLICFSVFLSVVKFSSAQDTITIDQAIATALSSNYDILLSRNDSAIASLNNNIGNAGMLPRLNFTLTDNYSVTHLTQKLANGTETDKSGVTSNSLVPALNFSWTLFDGLKMFATKGRLRNLEEIGRLNLKDTLQTMIAQVITAYYDVSSAQQQLRSLNEAIALFDETSKLAEVQFQVGYASKVAYLQAKVDLNASKSAALSQRNLIDQKKAILNQLLSRSAETQFNVTDSIPFNESPTITPIKDLDSKNFQTMIAAKNLQISRQVKKEVFSQVLPSLVIGSGSSSAGYSFTRSENSAGFSLYNQSYGPNIGFTFTVPLFNGLVYLHQIKMAKIAILNSDIKLQKVSLQNKINYYNALKNFETAKEALKLETENIALAKENAFIALERFRLAQSTAIELRQAQQSYVDAMTRLVTARFNAKSAETELLRIQGELVK